MTPKSKNAVTSLLQAWGGGDLEARDELIALVYADLRRLAGRRLRRERSAHTLSPTALVHEAFLRLSQQRDVTWRNRAQFFALAARAMRRVLVDHARTRAAVKRGGGLHVTSEDVEGLAAPRETSVLDLDAALTDLASLDAQQGRVVELRFFAGLSVEETADVLGVSPATVKRDWTHARAWLFRRMHSSPAPGDQSAGSTQ